MYTPGRVHGICTLEYPESFNGYSLVSEHIMVQIWYLLIFSRFPQLYNWCLWYMAVVQVCTFIYPYMAVVQVCTFIYPYMAVLHPLRTISFKENYTVKKIVESTKMCGCWSCKCDLSSASTPTQWHSAWMRQSVVYFKDTQKTKPIPKKCAIRDIFVCSAQFIFYVYILYYAYRHSPHYQCLLEKGRCTSVSGI